MASTEMITQLKKLKRNLGYLKVNFNIVDPNTDPDITSDDEEITSNIDVIKDDDLTRKIAYASLEKNYWALDGTFDFIDYNEDEGYSKELGYVSKTLSNADCEFETNPTLILTSDEYLTTIGLTLIFDNYKGNYVTSLNIKAYRDDTLILDDDLTLDSNNDRIVFADNDELVRWNKIVIEFIKTNLPYRRVRLSQLFIGIKQEYTQEKITSAETNEKTSMVNSELPTREFKFTIEDYDMLFNADNPNGWYRYILEKQEVKYEWGYELDPVDDRASEIEWVTGGKMLLDGSPTISNKEVTFSTVSQLSYLTNTYKKGIYEPNGKSFYDLAVDVFEFEGIDSSKYSISNKLKDIYTEAPLPSSPSRELLQMIATACNCTLYDDADGVTNIRPFEYKLNDDTWDYLFMTSTPEIELQTQLCNMNITIYQYNVSNEESELYKNEELEVTETTTLEITYDLATNMTATITNATIDKAEYYGRYAKLTITPINASEVVSLIITGNKVETSTTIESLKYNDSGEDNDYENELVTNLSEKCKDVRLSKFMGDWYNNRNMYSFDNRGDILKDTREIICFQTDFSDGINGYLVENNITYNGAWSGNSTLIKMEE